MAPERSVIGTVAQSVSNLVCSGLRTMRSIATSLSALLGFRTEPPCPYQTFLDSSEPMIFSTSCGDHLRLLHQRAIESVQTGLFLRIFRIASPTIVSSLKKKIQEEKEVVIHYQMLECAVDLPLTPNTHIVEHAKEGGKLMHQKAMVVDHKYVLFSTANYSDSSLVEDENVVLGIKSEKLSECIIQEVSDSFYIGSQPADYYVLPQNKVVVFTTIHKKLREAQISIQVAMLALTHPSLIRELQRAQQRNVKVEVFIDSDCRHQCIKYLQDLNCTFPVRCNSHSNKLHTKMCVIDNRILLVGSVNWSKSGLRINSEGMLILYNLTTTQQEKLEKIWLNLRAQCELVVLQKPSRKGRQRRNIRV